MKVLLIDDSLIFRKAQTKVLKKIGIEEIDEAENGKIALEKLEAANYNFTFVLLDINMPVMSGIETLRKIREKAPDLPVIMCTSEAGKDKIMQALTAGANTYLLKPINKVDMLQKVSPFMPSQTS